MSTDALTGDDTVDAALALIAARLRQSQGPAPQVASAGASTPLDVAKSIYRARRKRDQLLGELSPFGEPGWDILLDLYICGLEGRRVSVNSACIAAMVPPTTGLRWLALLEGTGALVRTRDHGDKRRAWVTLTEQGRSALTAYLETLL